MNLSAKYDIEAPVDFVYRELSDFDGWENMAMRRGAEVSRLDHLKTVGPGMEWQVSFPFRGKTRNVRLQLVSTTPTNQMTVNAVSKMVDGALTFDLLDLAATRTRIEVHIVAKPKTLAARIYVQTLRLARKKLEASFANRVAQFALDLEDRYRRPLAKRV